MRDLVLASQFKNSNIIFASQNLNGNINDKIIDSGYRVEVIKSNDVNEVIKLVQKNSIELVVIDSYIVDYKYEKILKDKTAVKILSFDDTYEKHHCDILLNHNISADKKRYKDLVPKDCELKCGEKYTLLRDEFIKEKKKNKKLNKEYTTIFLAMGGADHSNINIKILKVLEKFNGIKVNLVTTISNQNIKELKKYIKDKNWINLYVNSTKLAKLMRKSDFAIVTPSVTLNEVHYMQLPFIAIKTADNQNDIYKFIKKKKFLAMDKFKEKKLEKYMDLMLNEKR